MNKTLQTCGAIALLALVAGSARARQTGNRRPMRLQAVDPRHQDIGPLSTSLRVITSDLKPPADFEGVFKVRGHPGMLARKDGALTALFPRSVYWMAPEGQVIAQIPAGTVFVIGEPAPETLAPPGVYARASGEPAINAVDGNASPQPLATTLSAPVEAQLSVAAPLEHAAATGARLASAAVPAAPAPGPAPVPRTTRSPAKAESKLMQCGQVTTFDLSDESYRGRRLRYLARKLGPAMEP